MLKLSHEGKMKRLFGFCFSLLVLLFGLGGYFDIKSNG